ncbi:MAG: hypothetical protein COX46_02080, partial [bacterium (Candidatus Ratteibacteria) CG23_combo_of_CG06-09_8_20_14_all_48_7]
MENLTVRDYLTKKGIPFREVSGELITKCIFSDCDDDTKSSELPHLYINPETTEYFCHKCGAKGNFVTLARHLGDDIALPPEPASATYQPKEAPHATKMDISLDEIEKRAKKCHQQLPSN